MWMPEAVLRNQTVPAHSSCWLSSSFESSYVASVSTRRGCLLQHEFPFCSSERPRRCSHANFLLFEL